jgi:hypothetical protein
VSGVRQPTNLSALVRVVVILYKVERESCETTPTAFVVGSTPSIEGNEAHDVSPGRSSIVKTVGSIREQSGSGAPLARGEGSLLSMELLDRVFGPRVGFPLHRCTNED